MEHTLMDDRNEILADYFADIKLCLVHFGKLDEETAISLIHSSGILDRNSEYAMMALCHEEPYYWAMILLHPDKCNRRWEWEEMGIWPIPDEYYHLIS